jgi:hypothetical protein
MIKLAALLCFASLCSMSRADDKTSIVEDGAFGSGEPTERADMPARGVITLQPKDGKMSNMDHWLQFDWKFKAPRWGHYAVRMTYELQLASLGTQVKFGEERLRKTLLSSLTGRKVYFGELFVEKAGEHEISVYAPPSANGAGFDLLELALIPTNEGEPIIAPAADGSITLNAKEAVTWSETMRYEPKAEKNCLGYWTNPDDFAEWEFDATKPGKYQVLVTQGCGKDCGGSEVEVKLGESSTKFTVEDTGGFQNWKELPAGEIEIKAPGRQRLTIDPMNKKKTAVMDIQKVVLKPVS